jgi:hypothetical protein
MVQALRHPQQIRRRPVRQPAAEVALLSVRPEASRQKKLLRRLVAFVAAMSNAIEKCAMTLRYGAVVFAARV